MARIIELRVIPTFSMTTTSLTIALTVLVTHSGCSVTDESVMRVGKGMCTGACTGAGQALGRVKGRAPGKVLVGCTEALSESVGQIAGCSCRTPRAK